MQKGHTAVPAAGQCHLLEFSYFVTSEKILLFLASSLPQLADTERLKTAIELLLDKLCQGMQLPAITETIQNNTKSNKKPIEQRRPNSTGSNPYTFI